MFDEIITDYSILERKYIERDGYLFTSTFGPGNIYDSIVIKNLKNKNLRYRIWANSTKTLEEHIRFINKYKLEKAWIFASDLDFLKEVPSLKYIHIAICNEDNKIDYSTLYDIPEIKSLTIIRSDFERELIPPIDYLKINGLIDLGVSGKGHLNYEKVETLKSLFVSGGTQKDLTDMFSSKELDSLGLIECKVSSLNGINKSDKMQCLHLYYNRSLKDISDLQHVKKTMRALRIENCPKIDDFSVLEELENLEMLTLIGKNTLPDLQFIRKMENLKTFVFSMNVEDGDLTPCLQLAYAQCIKNRKHYNLKDKDLPKGKYIHGNENIEIWRRIN